MKIVLLTGLTAEGLPPWFSPLTSMIGAEGEGAIFRIVSNDRRVSG